ncbi:MAG: DUF4388 domain-containing protein [Elainellaceae cyanobacterium]
MDITGRITEFPLPELLQFLDRRKSTGCLSLEVFSEYYEELHPQHYTIWLSEGQIVAAYREGARSDVYALAVQKGWISPFVARKLKERAPKDIAAGLYLETQGALSFGQLRSLFFSEVVRRVEALCYVQNAEFSFRAIANLPLHEMTGLSIAAAKVAKQGMRRISLSSGRSQHSLKALKAELFSSKVQLPPCTSHLALFEC